jgi:transcriptional regulator with XRE-family HTH domain
MADANYTLVDQFKANLLRCRKLADMSQDEVSVRASVHRTEISQLERGLRVPRIDTLVKLASALEVSANELLEGIEWTPGRFYEGSFTNAPPREADPESGPGRGSR